LEKKAFTVVSKVNADIFLMMNLQLSVSKGAHTWIQICAGSKTLLKKHSEMKQSQDFCDFENFLMAMLLSI